MCRNRFSVNESVRSKSNTWRLVFSRNTQSYDSGASWWETTPTLPTWAWKKLFFKSQFFVGTFVLREDNAHTTKWAVYMKISPKFISGSDSHILALRSAISNVYGSDLFPSHQAVRIIAIMISAPSKLIDVILLNARPRTNLKIISFPTRNASNSSSLNWNLYGKSSS